MVQAPEVCAEMVSPDPAAAETYRGLYHRYLERARPTPHERRTILRSDSTNPDRTNPDSTNLGQRRGFSTSSRARGAGGGAAMQPAAFIHGKRDVRLGELPAPVAGTATST